MRACNTHMQCHTRQRNEMLARETKRLHSSFHCREHASNVLAQIPGLQGNDGVCDVHAMLWCGVHTCLIHAQRDVLRCAALAVCRSYVCFPQSQQCH